MIQNLFKKLLKLGSCDYLPNITNGGSNKLHSPILVNCLIPGRSNKLQTPINYGLTLIPGLTRRF